MENSNSNLISLALAGYLGLTTLAGAWCGNYIQERPYTHSKTQIERKIISGNIEERLSGEQDLANLNFKHKVHPHSGLIFGGILGFLLGLGLPLSIIPDVSNSDNDRYGYHSGHTWQ